MVSVFIAFITDALNYTNQSVAIWAKIDCSHLYSKIMDVLVSLWSNNDDLNPESYNYFF